MRNLRAFGRILAPDSKYVTFESRDHFLFNVTKSEEVKDIYYTLDLLNEKSDSIQKRMNLKISKSIGRNTEICFYDVTNYYFEIGENDSDELDKSGNVVKQGLRKKGISKHTIITSEIDKPDEEIISKYRGLSRIEDSFRITKSDLEGRPVFARTEEWENGLSAKRIQNALLNWQADELTGCYYRTTQPTKDLELILDAFGIKEKMVYQQLKNCML